MRQNLDTVAVRMQQCQQFNFQLPSRQSRCMARTRTDEACVCQVELQRWRQERHISYSLDFFLCFWAFQGPLYIGLDLRLFRRRYVADVQKMSKDPNIRSIFLSPAPSALKTGCWLSSCPWFSIVV
jgi:hypothetical protein